MPLTIDGKQMPNPSYNAVSCSDEKIWSSNTGRSKSAYMNGSITKVKRTVQLSFPPLTLAQLNMLNDVVSSASKPWHNIVLKDKSGNTVVSMTCYFGTPSWTAYSGAKNCQYYINYKVDAIER